VVNGVGAWRTRHSAAQMKEFARCGRWRGRTVRDFLEERCASEPDGPILVEPGRTLSYSELYGEAAALAASMQASGLGSGDVVSFQLPNWHEAFVVDVAASLLGAVSNPIVPIYRDSEVRHILADSRSRVFFIPRSFRNFDYPGMMDRLRPDLPALRDVVIVRDSAASQSNFSDLIERGRRLPLTPAARDANAVRLLMYTSGTTGPAKGVLHSDNTLMAEIDGIVDYWNITPRDVVLTPSPVTHITGYLFGMQLAVVSGMPTVFMERWNADEAIDLIEDHGVTLTVSATPFLQELVCKAEERRCSLPTLRLFACGGAPVPPELIHRAYQTLERCIACRIYGSTEAGPITLGVTDRSDESLAADTDGRIVGHEVRIVDPVTRSPVAFGEEGEITARGPNLFLGYTDEKETAASFSSDGFFHSGDLGRLFDGDYLLVTGRKKDLIIRGGENLSPKEIEDCLYTHPAVADVAVVGMPSERMGEAVCAFVVLRAGASLSIEESTVFLSGAGLAKQKSPERLEFVDELPRTAAGKVRKDVLRIEIARRLQGKFS